jgi:nitrogen fixation NifU-like protein
MAYSEEVKKRFDKATKQQEEKKKVFSKEDKTVGVGLVGAPACGDVMKVMIKVGADGKIEDSSFKIFGCGAAVASASLASEMIKDQYLSDALEVTNETISKALNLPPVKRHCSLLAEQAIKAAVEDYKKKNRIEATEE